MQVHIPELMTMTDVRRTLRRSRASIYRDIDAGRIPKPLKFGSSVRWLSAEIQAVMDRLVEKRDAE